MKPILSSVFRLLLMTVCSSLPAIAQSDPVPIISSPAIEVSAEPPLVDSFTFEELLKIGGGGCGMVLWKGSGTHEDGLIFFNGLLESTALMKVDGKFVNFRRIEAEGKDFYGQKTGQVFISPDETIRVAIEVKLGEPGLESVAIESGTLRISRNGQTLDIPVAGDAGC
ncbi:hypothetical protein [Lyngbya sp. CCY1209]|uniref:hypothetical protein n=1 Tax=Lyngbya sp. CCY1209 TaxID=2886103 RepID=UPI002D1FF77A|nr:hypothetical protein [Lyngbya sp. CCY1209]MEB3883985.1 hypothetical protein [Lyngbya sp. CCY1209]